MQTEVATVSLIFAFFLMVRLLNRFSASKKLLLSTLGDLFNRKTKIKLFTFSDIERLKIMIKAVDSDMENFIKFKKGGKLSIDNRFYYNAEGEKKENTVFGLMLSKKKSQVDAVYFFNYGMLCVYGIGTFAGGFPAIIWIPLGIFVLALAARLDCYLMESRALSGEYGNNRFEAEELITFIVNNSDDPDLGGPGRKILPDAESKVDNEKWIGATNE